MASTRPSRLWSVNAGKCLVLTVNSDNNVESVTCKELDDNARESSIVEFKEADESGPNAICWRIVFTLDGKQYALHVDNSDTVTALEAPDKDALKKATYFAPTDSVSVSHPAFVGLGVGPCGTSQRKYITVNKEGGLSVQAFGPTQVPLGIIFAKIEEKQECKNVDK